MSKSLSRDLRQRRILTFGMAQLTEWLHHSNPDQDSHLGLEPFPQKSGERLQCPGEESYPGSGLRVSGLGCRDLRQRRILTSGEISKKQSMYCHGICRPRFSAF